MSFYPTIQPQASSKKLNKLRIKIITNSSKTNKNSINDEYNNTYIESKTGVYEISCLNCNKKDIWRNLLVA